MNPTIWAVFAITELLLCLTPGPAVLLVLSQALMRGAAKSLVSSAGILVANLIYFIISATSLGALLIASHNLFLAIKWIGAAYLIYLGLAAVFGKTDVLAVSTENLEMTGRRAGYGRQFVNAVMLQLANPKALLFFTAFLPQFIAPTYPIGRQVAILAVTSIIIEFFVLLGYGVLAGQATAYAQRPRFARATNCLAGAMLIAAGVGMASLTHL